MRLIITTLSPLLTVNDHGHPEARFPKRELAKALGLDTTEPTLWCSYTRTEVIGGYNAHLRLPRQQWPAIAAGSVFVFDIEQTLDQERLLQLERDGLGLRRGEGYGRIAVNRQNDLDLNGCKETQLEDPDSQAGSYVPDSKIPQEIQDLLLGVVRSGCLAEMQQRAMTVAGRAQNVPSNALLGRLRLFLQQDSLSESLEKLRKPAREQLTSYQIDMRDFGEPELPPRMTLYDLFKKAWTEPESLTGKLIKNRVEELAVDCDKDTLKTMSATLCRAFFDHLLTALHRQSRA